MNKLKIAASILACSLAAGSGWAEDPNSSAEKGKENRAEKPARRLKGEFKGHPIAPPAEAESDGKQEPPKTPAAKKPAAENEKKKAGKSAGKPPEKPFVIDNALIGSGTPKSGGKAEAPRAAPASPAAPPPAAVTSIAPVDLNGNGEAYWRAKAKQLRDNLAQAQKTLEAAQLEEKREENDFYSWDDGQYRDNVIKPAWDRSREETARAQEELVAAQKAVDELDDDARKAGAYPGWIRE